MQQSQLSKRRCLSCQTNPVSKVCLSSDCLKNSQFLLCKQCIKEKFIKLYPKQICSVDSLTHPLNVLSINSGRANAESVREEIQKKVKMCHDTLFTWFEELHNKLQGIFTDQMLEGMDCLIETFKSQSSEQLQQLILNEDFQDQQENKKSRLNQIKEKLIKMIWINKNSDKVQDQDILKDSINQHLKNILSTTEKNFKIMNKCLQSIKKQINYQKIFQKTELLKDKKNENKESSAAESSKSPPKSLPKIPSKSPSQIQASQKIQKSYKRIQQQRKKKKSSKHSKIPNANIKLQNRIQQQSQNQKVNSTVARIQTKKMNGSSTGEKMMVQPSILEMPSVKSISQYFDEQVLVIDKNFLGSIMCLVFNHNKMVSQISKTPMKIEGVYQPSFQQKIQINLIKQKLNKVKCLILDSLPENFYLLAPERDKEKQGDNQQMHHSTQKLEKYKIDQAFYSFLQSLNLQGLQQLHIYSKNCIPSQRQISDYILVNFQNLKVLSINCSNIMNQILQRYYQLMGQGIKNMQLQYLDVYCGLPDGMENIDLKKYYPEDSFCQKFFNEYFAMNYNDIIQDQNKALAQKDQKIELTHKGACWFQPSNSAYQDYVKTIHKNQFLPTQTLQLMKTFPNLRTLSLNYMHLQVIQNLKQNHDLRRIQHLTWGFRSKSLQSVSPQFYDSIHQNVFLNLKSLTLLNISLCAPLFKRFYNANCKSLKSLQIIFCSALPQSFYDSLPSVSPLLQKLSINCMQDISGDFIVKLPKLKTLILPWSKIDITSTLEKQRIKIAQMMMSARSNKFGVHNNQNNHEHQGQTLLKYSFVNLCKKIHQNNNVDGSNWISGQFLSALNLSVLEHLNIGKCRFLQSQDKSTDQIMQLIISLLSECENLKSLCLDYLPVTNKQLIELLGKLHSLQRLSISHCDKIDLSCWNQDLVSKHLDKLTHIDMRIIKNLSSDKTRLLQSPKYLCLARGFDVQIGQLNEFCRNNIEVFNSKQFKLPNPRINVQKKL